MVAAVVLVGLVLSAGLSRALRWGGVALLAAVSVLWLVVNGPMEGPVLLVFSTDRGLTGADLASVAGLGLAVAQAVRLRRPETVRR
jgi:hypothetical protein